MVREKDKSRYVWGDGDTKMLKCGYCRHWSGGGKCVAFPIGIPNAILNMDIGHTKPYKGDNGRQFEPITE